MPTNLSISASRNVVMWTNTFTLLAGLILFAIGLFGLFSPDVRLYSDALPLATLIVGLLVFLISIIGCCGAMWDHRPVLIVYSVILATLVIIQVIAAIIAIADSQNIGSVLDRAWDVTYNNNPKIIRDIEDEYECCGFKNTTDRAFPKPEYGGNCTKSPGFKTPCYNSICNSYKHHQTFLEIGGLFLALIQLLALVCTALLIYKLPNNEERERQYRDEHQRLVEEGRRHTSSGQYKSHGAHASDNCASSTAYGST